MAKRVSKPALRRPMARHLARRFTSQDVHEAVFASEPKKHALDELKDGIRVAIRQRRPRA